MMMINISRNCGYLFVGLSLLLQVLTRFTTLPLTRKQELATAAKEASGAGIFFMIASWCFAMLARQTMGSALVMQHMGMVYCAAFAFWCIALLFKEAESGKRTLYGELRGHSLWYAVFYCVLSYLLV